MSTARITDAQKSALKWLKNRGGDGVFDMTRCLIARGERAGVMRSTWSRLEAFGLIERYDKRRVRITDAGARFDTGDVGEADCA
jgi:hypothetical protein